MNEKLRKADKRAQAVANEAAASARAWSAKNIADGGVCDFCCHLLEPGHFVTYIVPPMIGTLSMIDVEDHGTGTVTLIDDSQWAACDKCDPIIAEADPLKLTAHVLANRDVERAGDFPPELLPIIHADLVDLYTKFLRGQPTTEGRAMKIMLELELGNDAMQTPYDVVTSIRNSLFAHDNPRTEPMANGEQGALFDGNGNSVGTWIVAT